MDEKQRLMEAEAAQTAAVESIPPPPAYADVEVSIETIEVVSAPPRLPSWIQRLPITLPLAHFMFSVPLALFFARSFGSAVFICSSVSFWLVASATAGIARATREDVRLQKAGVRYLFAAGFVMVVWPFVVGILLAPGRISRCHRMMRYPHHIHQQQHAHGIPTIITSHGNNGRVFQLHHASTAPIVATAGAAMHQMHHHQTATIASSKGPRILIAAVGQRLEQIKHVATHVHVVVSSKGVKSLWANNGAEEEEKSVPTAQQEQEEVQIQTEQLAAAEEELR